MHVAIAIQNYYTLDNYYEELSGVYEDQGRLDSALFYHKKLQDVRDTLFNLNKSNIVSEMQTELANERSLREIDLLKEKDKNLIRFRRFGRAIAIVGDPCLQSLSCEET